MRVFIAWLTVGLLIAAGGGGAAAHGGVVRRSPDGSTVLFGCPAFQYIASIVGVGYLFMTAAIAILHLLLFASTRVDTESASE